MHRSNEKMHGNCEKCMATAKNAWQLRKMHGNCEKCMATAKNAWQLRKMHGNCDSGIETGRSQLLKAIGEACKRVFETSLLSSC